MQRVGLGDRGDVDDEVAVFPDVDEGVFEGESVGARLQAGRQYRRGKPPHGGEAKGGGVGRRGAAHGRGEKSEGGAFVAFAGGDGVAPREIRGGPTLPIKSL